MQTITKHFLACAHNDQLYRFLLFVSTPIKCGICGKQIYNIHFYEPLGLEAFAQNLALYTALFQLTLNIHPISSDRHLSAGLLSAITVRFELKLNPRIQHTCTYQAPNLLRGQSTAPEVRGSRSFLNDLNSEFFLSSVMIGRTMHVVHGGGELIDL